MDWAVVIMFGGMSCFTFLGLLFIRKICRKEWRKQSWEGVVIGKYWGTYDTKHINVKRYYVEVCYDQTVKVEEIFVNERWKSIEIGDYVIKKSGNESIEKRAIQEEEAGEVRHVLSRRLIYRDREIRSRAADALGHIGDERAAPVLIEALRDKASEVRQKAAQALGQIGDVSAVPSLAEALKDKKKKVRMNAA